MLKRLSVLGFGFLVVGIATGCDEETIAKVAPDAAKMFTATQGLQSGDVLMDRVQQHDRLRDGTGGNCTNPGDPGSCDGSGPYGAGGDGNGNGGGYGTGAGGGDRLRDGSCGG
jgi:hypothetical protein